MIINPDGWSVLSLLRENGTRTYKIFSSWKHNDVWRLSSGANNLKDITVEGECLVWPQMSGSVYELSFSGQNISTPYTLSILSQKIIPTLTEGRIKLTRLDLIQNGSFDINSVKETELNDIKDFNPTRFGDNALINQSDSNSDAPVEDKQSGHYKLANEFNELFKRIESPKNPLGIFRATEEELRITYKAGKTEDNNKG
ncbi:hypothetical protein [Pseudoalteromonas sp. CH_XMU1449-3]|uniref:hypothetical protein n=1 Tax=Pseudoalteromonas sp. CH_XMU1449-3 TaxID=3107774 RepID=UPI0030083C07